MFTRDCKSSRSGAAAPAALSVGAPCEGADGSGGHWDAAAMTGVGPAGSLHNVPGVM
jgi:hypothetical protein